MLILKSETPEATDKQKRIAVILVILAAIFPLLAGWLTATEALPVRLFIQKTFHGLPRAANLILASVIYAGPGVLALCFLPCSRQAKIFISVIYMVLALAAAFAVALLTGCSEGNCF